MSAPRTPSRPSGPHAPAPVVFGLLGGIASGKSAVASRLAGPEGVVIDADRIAHEVLAEPETVAFLERAFGPEVLDAAGRPDRAALARRVFASDGALARLEGFTHPRIRARIRTSLEDARAAGRPRIVLDVPLLIENDAEHGLVGECDVLVFVDVDRAERARRAREARGWTAGELARREAVQLPLSRKKARADHVLPNDGTLAELDSHVQQLLDSIAAR